MSDAITLPALLRRESRSLLQYVRESFPWSQVKDRDTSARVLSAGVTEGGILMQLGRLLQKRRIVMPALGAYPSSFTSVNYVALSYLIPRLVAAQRLLLADLERDLHNVQDDEIRALLDAFRELKRRHLAELESLVGAGKAA